MLLLKLLPLENYTSRWYPCYSEVLCFKFKRSPSLFCILTNSLKEIADWVSLTSKSLTLWLYINVLHLHTVKKITVKISLFTFSDFLIHFLILLYNLDPWSDLSFGKYHLWILWYNPHQRTGRCLLQITVSLRA